jgi:hypothetical protein
MVDPAGRSANSNGSGLETSICLPFQRKGFVELDARQKRDFERVAGDVTAVPFERWYARQVKLERGIYGSYIKSDLFVRDPVHFADGLHIECKWQQTPGSVDEKYPYTMLSLLTYQRPSIFVLAGRGARPTSVEWLRAKAEASKGHVRFFSGTDEVVAYLNKMLTQA